MCSAVGQRGPIVRGEHLAVGRVGVTEDGLPDKVLQVGRLHDADVLQVGRLPNTEATDDTYPAALPGPGRFILAMISCRSAQALAFSPGLRSR